MIITYDFYGLLGNWFIHRCMDNFPILGIELELFIQMQMTLLSMIYSLIFHPYSFSSPAAESLFTIFSWAQAIQCPMELQTHEFWILKY